MSDMRSQEQIDEMRKRLYDRSAAVSDVVRHQLSDTPVDVSRDWAVKTPSVPHTSDLRQGMESDIGTASETESEPVVKKKRHYRSFVVFGSLLIFVFVASISSLFLYFGGNQISNENISIALEGPSTIGGGEVLLGQIAVTNLNAVPMESATLIVKYPTGARSAGQSPRSLYEERISLGEIGSGEVRNESITAAIFGEENEEQAISATVEYRIGGSNTMYYKEASDLTFKVISSPLVIRIDSLEKVASGQLVDITLTAVSNASSPLENVLISAEFPNGFAYKTSDPSPVFGDNVWKIDSLQPEQSVAIHLQGVVTGETDETFRINFAAGPAESENQFIVGSTLANAYTDFLIERPFVDVSIAIAGVTDKAAVIQGGERVTVDITMTNTLDETIYDMAVEATPSGNALDENSIRSDKGFYDSNRQAVRWEVSNNPTFGEILPGQTRTLAFEVFPNELRTNAAFDLDIKIFARRVSESSAQETLIGTTRGGAKYSATIALASQIGRNTSQYVDSGPVPPKAGEVTTYTVTLAATAGANDTANAIVNTSLPLYVDWLDSYTGDGTVTYNTVSKQLQWVIGDIPAGVTKELSYQVSILPSTSQVNSVPVITNSQSLRANDSFTSTLLQDTVQAVTTELSTEMGFAKDNGVVAR